MITQQSTTPTSIETLQVPERVHARARVIDAGCNAVFAVTEQYVVEFAPVDEAPATPAAVMRSLPVVLHAEQQDMAADARQQIRDI